MSASDSAFARAVDAWRTCLGAEYVELSEDACRVASTATFSLPDNRRYRAILSPPSREKVAACVRIAAEHSIPLYAVSRGKNWGLGSRAATVPGCVLLSLHLLDSILDYDVEFGTITVEPGVTFEQVHTFLLAQGSPFFLSVTGSSPEGSLIGNALERGDGIGPYGERHAHASALEVVLPSGEVIETGFGQFADAPDTRFLYPQGLGPSLDGLFAQSSLGIVTRMTFWLRPLPAKLVLFSAQIETDDQLVPLLRALRELLLRGVLAPNSCHVWNDFKVLGRRQQFPFDAFPSGESLMDADLGVSPWMLSGALYGESRRHADALSELLELAVSPHVSKCFLFDQEDYPDIAAQSGYVGVPTWANAKGMYWRKKQTPPDRPQPEKDRCGVSWLCPLLPFDGRVLVALSTLIREYVREAGLEPNIGLSCASGRYLRMFVALHYDRDEDGADERAARCHDELLRVMCEQGAFPYRLGLQSMSEVPGLSPAYQELVWNIKQALDPKDIFSPGRYIRPVGEK
jgi:4-cresol dehydrogenase (hydroxylating)